MNITYSKQAVKVINRLDTTTKQRIRKAIELLPDGDVKLLQGRVLTHWLRVGDWRVWFSYPDGDTILVEKIGPRGQVYKEA